MTSSFSKAVFALTAVSGTLLFGGCKPVDDRVEITSTREIGDYPQKVQLGLTFRERVGITTPSAAEGGGDPSGPPFAWVTPEGWKEAPASSMRVANFTIGENDEVECYFSAIPGGGSLLENVNRWRSQQMGLPEIDEATAAALPDQPLLFAAGKLVDLKGNYTGMGAGAAKPDYRMLGVVLPASETGGLGASFFVKMIGPAAIVDGERANFDAFCRSLQIKTR